MATYKQLAASDIRTGRSYMPQIIDIIQENISGSTTRQKYEIFITGGVGPGVTSSLWQTVYDQDFSLQTANPILDITIGLSEQSGPVTGSTTGTDANGKLLFPSQSLMMREKIDLYRQFAQVLLGNASSRFTIDQSSTVTSNIDEAMFISFKRLYSRDVMKRETLAINFYTGSNSVSTIGIGGPNNTSITDGLRIFTDFSSSINKLNGFGGNYGRIVDSSDTTRGVGLMFYDRGIAVLDLSRIINNSQTLTGTIDSVNSTGSDTWISGQARKFNPQFLVSASIDDIVDHLCYTRFQSGTLTAITLQNQTNVNSLLVRCNLSADEFNYSSNPTYVDSNNRIVVIDEGQEETQQSFTFITKIGLYNANNDLLAVGSLSRPILKDSLRDFQVVLRLDT